MKDKPWEVRNVPFNIFQCSLLVNSVCAPCLLVKKNSLKFINQALAYTALRPISEKRYIRNILMMVKKAIICHLIFSERDKK